MISVAARLAGLPSWFLRVLDDEGIVVPVRTDSNRRLYSDNDIAVLGRVRHLTEERGVNVAGVKVILEMERERHAAAPSSPEQVTEDEFTAPTADATSPLRRIAASPAVVSGALPPVPVLEGNSVPDR